jgi:hypothetical protein
MGGSLVKLAVGAFLVGLASQMGALAKDVLGRVRVSVQASELHTLDGHLWANTLEQRQTLPPADQAAFERAVRELFAARGDREVTHDRWGQPYLYARLGVRPVRWRIVSKGPDRRIATADDLVLERSDDRVSMNVDPVRVAEEALDVQAAHQAALVERLRELGAQLDAGEAPEAPLFPERRAPARRGANAAELRELSAELERLLAG